MMIFKKYLFPSTLILSAIVAMTVLPINNSAIALCEFGAEVFLLTKLLIYYFNNRKEKINAEIILFIISILFLLAADTIYGARIINITHNYGLLADCLYTGFSLFLLLYLIKKLNIYKININEWGWISLTALSIDILLSYFFLLEPYYKTADPLAWKINGTIYMILTSIIFSLILPFSFRSTDRRTFWFLNFLILLLTSDFAVRYQDAFIDTSMYSWAEISWFFTFIGLSWLVDYSHGKRSLFIESPIKLAPFISVRCLLTLAICATNSLLLIGILSFKIYSLKTAIDISSILLLLFLFWTIASEFSLWLANDLERTLKLMFKSKENLSENGLIHLHLEQVNAKNPIFEISKIFESYNDLVGQANNMMDIVVKFNKNTTMAEIASQVSHDIRSPLAALDMVVQDLPELAEEKRILIRSSISRIKDIANNLLQNYPKIPNNNLTNSDSCQKAEIISIQLLSCLIDRLLSEKRMQFRSKIGIQIDSELDETSYGIFANISSREFMRLMSNIINNAVEAIKNSGRVIISLSRTDEHATVSVADNGSGISPEILHELGKRGETYGKKDGLGLGLYHARTTIESWGGSLKIESELNVGTSVSFTLPLANSAYWFVSNINIHSNYNVIILDDDISIHQIWDERFYQADGNSDINLLHFSTPEELILWHEKNKNIISNTLFLIDYELLGHKLVGLDVIENLGIQKNSILVTSHYEEVGIRNRCKRLGVQLIPKGMAGFVPITIQTC